MMSFHCRERVAWSTSRGLLCNSIERTNESWIVGATVSKQAPLYVGGFTRERFARLWRLLREVTATAPE